MVLNSFVKRGENIFEKFLKNLLSILLKFVDLFNFELVIVLFILLIVNGGLSCGNIGGLVNLGLGFL